MKKQLVCSVMIMSLALIMTGCGGTSDSKVPEPTTQQEVVIEKEATVVSYDKEIELGAGETLTLDKLNIVTDGDIEFDFSEKTYNEVGSFDEVITYEDGELAVKVIVVDKTAPVISGTHDITVTEGEAINILNGVSTNEEAELKVSDYDSSLLDATQTVTITATDTAGNISEVTVNLTIKSNPIESMDKTMYASSSVNVRAGASADTEKLGSLSLNESVHVIGKDKASGWYQIEYNGSVGYVSNSYLSDSKTEVKTQNTNNSSSSNKTNNGSSSDSGSSSKTNQSDNPGSDFDGNIGVDSEEDWEKEDEAMYEKLKEEGLIDEDGNPTPPDYNISN